ncbi:MAG: signal peptidase II [Rhodospirillales bacterium]|nr:signal peptidase II [Rhodospirillales bacterium]
MRPILLIALVVSIADQVSKWIILKQVMVPPRVMGDKIEVTDFLNLVLVYNRGISFGLLSNDTIPGPYLLAGVALIIASGVLVWAARQRRAILTFAASLIVGGAAGNLIDRLVHGAVVDFLDFHAAGFHWPAFNLADCAIVTGVGVLFVDVFRGSRPPAK